MKNRKAAFKKKHEELLEAHRLDIQRLKAKHDGEIQDLTKFYKTQITELKDKNSKLKIIVQEKANANSNMISLIKDLKPSSYQEHRRLQSIVNDKNFWS